MRVSSPLGCSLRRGRSPNRTSLVSPIRRRCTPTLFPASLGLHPWGDGRLVIAGTEGMIEMRKYIDVGGEKGTDLGGPRSWDSRSRLLRCNPAGFDIGSGADATAGLRPLLFISSISNSLSVAVPVGMWAKASISPPSELAREAGEAQPVGNADRPHIHRSSW